MGTPNVVDAASLMGALGWFILELLELLELLYLVLLRLSLS
jgi:hypothetical protein